MLDLFDSDNCAARSQEDWKTYVKELPDDDSSDPRHVIDTDPCCQSCGESSCRCKDNSGSFFYSNGSICQQSSRRCENGDPDHTSPWPTTAQPPDNKSQDTTTPEGAWSVLLTSPGPKTAKSPDVGSQDTTTPEGAWSGLPTSPGTETAKSPDVGSQDQTLKWALPLVFMGGVILAVAIMAGVTKWRRKNTRPSADAVELSEPRAAGRSPLGPEPFIHLHLNIGSLSELRSPSPSPVRLPITGPSTQTMASESSAAALEQPSARGQSQCGSESSTLPQVNTTWNGRQEHPSPPPVRTTARALSLPDDPPPLPQHPPPHPVGQPARTPSYLDPTSSDDGYVKPSTPPSNDSEMPYSYVHTFPGSVLPGGNHSTLPVSSRTYEDMTGPRTFPRRQTLRHILNQVNSVRRNLNIWFSQK